MSLNCDLPDWLESFRPDDDLYADAYEGTPAPLRALLKTAIAFAFHRYRADAGESRTETKSSRAGFFRMETSRPADWVLAVAAEGFASPARLLGALVPAVVAGAGRIALVSPAPFAPAVATALELSGLEDSFTLDDERTADLYEDLRAASPNGRVIVFPGPEPLTPGQKDVLHRAAADGVPVFCDHAAPRLLSLYGKIDGHEDGLSPEEMRSRLLWLHPDAVLLDEPAPGMNAVFAPEGVLPPFEAPLLAGPGMEACWQSLDPDFFLTRTLSAHLVQENQS